MGNHILNYGVTTPFVLFNFAAGSIESTIKPKYFVDLTHNRTCKQACTFTLKIMYVPDTFEEGRPTLIDNMLVTSRNQRVTYQYGYYDWRGARHVQYQTYVGQLNKYDCDVDIASGCITYTVQGNAVAVELLNEQVTLLNSDHNKYKWTPAEVVEISSRTDFETRPFYKLGLYYDRVISQTDEFVPLPDYTQQGMMNIILGTAKAAKDSDNNELQTNIDRDGGIVQHSRVKLYNTIQEMYNAGVITAEEFITFPNSASLSLELNALNALSNIGNIADNGRANTMINKINNLWYSPFMSYFDDFASMSHKYGTFYYVPKEKGMASDTFVYEYGNNVQQSDVINVSFSYDGSVALANSSASSSIAASIDDEGTNIGQTNSTTNVLSLGRNTYPTLSGFKEDRFLSQRELSSYMIYPSKATITIMGQIQPSNLLDVVDLIIFINGTKHPTLSGEYTVLGITDNVSSSGFTTTLELVRKEEVQNLKFETYVTNPTNGKASKNDQARTDANYEGTNT